MKVCSTGKVKFFNRKSKTGIIVSPAIDGNISFNETDIKYNTSSFTTVKPGQTVVFKPNYLNKKIAATDIKIISE